MRKAVSWATWVLLALVLAGLAGTTAAAVVAIDGANDRVTQRREVVARFASLQEAVAEEAFAEAGYRRAPGPESWRRLEAAIAAVPTRIAEARAGASRVDALTLSQLGLVNSRYVAQMRADRRGARSHTDDRVAGPALDAINRMLGATLDKHRASVTEATRQQDHTITRLAILLAIVFTIAFGVLGWTIRLTRLEHRRLRTESETYRTSALTDSLTGLPNRPALLATMESALARPVAHSALLFLDLDHFKPVNDTWGHAAGDEVLRQVARRLQDSIRTGDLAARLGGDEFAVFLPRGEVAEVAAERIIAALERPFHVDGHAVRLGTSIGIADTRLAGHEPETLLRMADQALYAAKSAGRGRAVVHQEA